MKYLPTLLSVSVCVCLWLTPALAADTPPAPPIISHIKVVSNNVEDVSSLDAWQKTVIKPSMTDAEKALAVWTTVVKFRHHDSPAPREYLTNDPDVYDAIKLFNVYGYCTGKAAQPAFLELARYAGFTARHLSVYRFGEPEVFYNNAWHNYDPAMITYFPKPDGQIASVEELGQAVTAWHKEHPGCHDNGDKLKAFMKDPGWKTGPALIAACPTLQPNGNYPFSSFGWYSAMVIYDFDAPKAKPAFVYEEPYSQGYQVNNQLRPGERLTFNWSNKGLHIDMLDDAGAGADPKKNQPACLTAPSGQKSLAYMTAYGDLSNQRIGNGTLEYTPPLASLKDTALTFKNFDASALADDTLKPAHPVEPGFLILDMPCSYVYLAGTLRFNLNMGATGSVLVHISDNNGLDWTEVAKLGSKNNGWVNLDLQKFIFRRYDYRLKFTIIGDAVLGGLKITHDFQNSQRALPALAQGDNTLNFSAGPSEGTLTIEPAPTKWKDKQLTAASYHAVLNNLTEDESGHFAPTAAEDATLTYEITTPTPLTRLRLGSQYRAQNKDTCWLYQVSFDGGKTFTTMDTTHGRQRSEFDWTTYDKIPANTTSAQVRFTAIGGANVILFHHRIDADYLHPVPAGAPAFTPILATYTWTEDSKDKTDTHVSFTPAETWHINCATKPTMKSLTLERAP